MHPVPDRLAQLRKESALTMDNVAQRIGVAKATIHKYEAGIIKEIPIAKFEALAALYRVNPAWLMGWQENRR